MSMLCMTNIITLIYEYNKLYINDVSDIRIEIHSVLGWNACLYLKVTAPNFKVINPDLVKMWIMA